MKTLKDKSSVDWVVIIPIALIIILLLFILFHSLDLNELEAWLGQSITALKIGELLVIIIVSNILFGNSK